MNKVKYLGEGPKDNWKDSIKTGIIGLGIAALSITGAYYAFSKDEVDEKERVRRSIEAIEEIDKIGIGKEDQREKSLDDQVNDVIFKVSVDDKVLDDNYLKFLKLINKRLDQHPDYANQMIVYSLNSLEKSGSSITKEAYMEMFKHIRIKAEQKPEMMDHFGDNAQRYMKNKLSRDLYNKVKESFETIGRELDSSYNQIKDGQIKPKWWEDNIDKPIINAYDNIKKEFQNDQED